ncbi:hypothetical protein HPB48_000241 [Haemaphysalis longicornis]|uniref:Uncharacterized protein n=1 Tax=Haemaphysalis longicornis TaxID=44386 RepID=A0A9J6H4N6_HAELO|nr:hypothetical protein HPB48_000241 [Haemaphysalis longicornis]
MGYSSRTQVTRHMEEAHGIDVRRLHMPELQYSFSTWLKVAAAKDPTPLAELFRPGGFNVFVELLRVLVGAGRHTLAVLAACRMAAQYHFASKEKATAFVAHVESLRDRLEQTLGDDGVLILPATISAAPFQNEDLLYLDLPSFMALFNLFETPATACPVSTRTYEGRRTASHSSAGGGEARERQTLFCRGQGTGEEVWWLGGPRSRRLSRGAGSVGHFYRESIRSAVTRTRTGEL